MNVSFLIALQIDSNDRLSNLQISTNNLRYHFPDSEIIVSELDNESKIGKEFCHCNHVFTKTSEFFNKQKAYNIAAKHSSHDVICLYDADVIIHPKAIQKSVDMVINKEAEIVWPYDGRFYDVPKKYHSEINDIKSTKNVLLEDCTLFCSTSVGGAVFFDKNVFIKGGMGNENFKGAGWEDNEIYERFTKLGFSRAKLDTYLLHLTHDRKETSYNHNPYGKHNEQEFSRIYKMPKHQLLNEIATWEWSKQ